MGGHHAQLGGRRLGAHAEKRQRRADQDDLAETQREEDEDGGDAVQREVAPDQREVGHAERTPGLDELLLHHPDRGPAGHAGHVWHRGGHKGDQHGRHAGPGDGGDGQADQDGGKCQHHIDQAHDPAVEPLVERRENAEHAAEEAAAHHADQAEHQCVARAVDQPAEDVATVAVGPEQVFPAWRGHDIEEVDVIGIVGRHELGEDSRQHDHHQGDGGHGGHLVARQPPQQRGPRHLRTARGGHGGGRIHRRAHQRCILGSR